MQLQDSLPLKPIQIGHATFSPKMNRAALKKLLNSNREKDLKGDTWMVPCDSPSSNWSDIFPLMVTTKNLNLRLIAGYLRESIFTQISHIHFSCLQQLNLLNNQITSVEGIMFLDCPFLQKIGISTNRIAIISPLLSKIYYPKLKLIDCSNNYFSEACLERFLVKEEEVKLFLLYEEDRIGTIEDIALFAKCPLYLWPKSLEYFTAYQFPRAIHPNKYISQPRSARTLIKKFKKPILDLRMKNSQQK